MAKISVVIPVYNVEKYLRECLDSIINQTLTDIEILCIDDGSSDNSIEILNEYKNADSRIKIFNGKHNGSGAARNLGLQNAQGEYIIFLDSDDFFELNMLEEMYNKALETQSDIVVCDYNAFDITLNKFSKQRAKVFPEDFFKKEVFNYKDLPKNIFDYFHNAAWNKLYNLDFIKREELKFQEIKRSNDLYFTRASIVLAERISGINKIFVHYRIGQNTNLQSNNYKYPTEFAKSLIELKEFLEQKGMYDELKTSFEQFAINVINCNLANLRKRPIIRLGLYNYIHKELAKQLNISEKFFNPLFSFYETKTHVIIILLGLKLQLNKNKFISTKN